ncbi:MAG: hypothetical protein FWF02_03850 [Micrococcales bacterium]|nr:hypothetical protein [Micrococcales bacterium]MCL2666823.1 hypothetical protein [Micrococcales bacterium]
MARTLQFDLGGQSYAAVPTKVDRKKLYGWSETVAVDDDGNALQVAAVDATGTIVIPSGGVGYALVDDDGCWVERTALRAVTPDGADAEPVGSSFDAPVVLAETASADDLLAHAVTAVYQLVDAPDGFADAVGTVIYRFEYAFRAGYTSSPAFLLVSDGVVFLLVGRPTVFELVGLDQPAVVDDDSDEVDDDDEIDFSMM